MDVSYDGVEVIVLMEEIEEVYYIFFGSFKKKKKYKIYGEKVKKFRLVIVFWLLMVFINKFVWGVVLKKI